MAPIDPETFLSYEAGPEVEEFANALDDCLSPPLSNEERRERILDLPRKYHENALRRLAQVRPRITRNGQDDVDMDTDDVDAANSNPASAELVKRLEREAQTWDLLRRLLPLRYAISGTDQHAIRPQKSSMESGDLVRNFLASDPAARERQAVIQWLQNNAASGPDIDELARELQQNADRGDIIAHGWLHTRSSIKLRKSVTAWPHLLDRQSPAIETSFHNSDGSPLVTQLDPDAATRQGRKLEPQDEYFERAIWLGCWEHLRRGSSLDTIHEWCHERTEMWRAISTSAVLLSADDSQEVSNTKPASLALWRRMCFSLSRSGGCDDYERAVYGVLSGDILSVEKVSLNWDDFLFANYNALLRTQLDNYILGQCSSDIASSLTQSFPSFDAVQFHGEPETVDVRLVRALESNPQIKDEANEPNKALQASLISREIGQHLYQQGLIISSCANQNETALYRWGPRNLEIHKERFFQPTQHHGLRIVAHIYLLIKLMDKLDSKNDSLAPAFSPSDMRRAQQNLVAGYANYLRLAQFHELIPLYCSILEPPRSYEVLSYNLIPEQDAGRRLMQLRLIRKAGIDVFEFVKTQARLLFDDLGPAQQGCPAKESFTIIEPGPPTSRRGRPVKPDFFGDDEKFVDQAHENLIRSLEWLLLVQETWPHVFSMGTKIYKFFLYNMHLNAARQLMKRVPFSEVLQAATEESGDEIELYEDTPQFWARQLDRRDIRDVTPQQALSDARKFRELENLVRALDSLETVASLAELTNEEQKKKLEFWAAIADEVKNTKENIQPLLKNWLLVDIEEGDKELRDLRQAYLPETILAYVGTLHFAGTGLSRDNLLECMELASIIAERDSDLSIAFVEAGRMKELVEVFAASSKALAISTGEKRTASTGSKKLREMGWSRDLCKETLLESGRTELTISMASFAAEMQGATPPVLPPKPGSHETSRIATPTSASVPSPSEGRFPSNTVNPVPTSIPDPGDQWLPQILRDKSKQDLAELLGNPTLLNALTHSPESIHPSLLASHQALSAALNGNIELATQLSDMEARLSHQRASTQAQLLSTHTLERQWRQKQSDMDHALAPFSPSALYQQLGQGVLEQASVCEVMEESFLDGEGEGVSATEREVTDWVRRWIINPALWAIVQ
ncbi:nuclear pore [Fusarium beomiforme]|uniref:Nuclear pore complex protein n=1 Tax=Fusarium beomiforme TaxID=44412 RepID=A0A9P5AGQ4_9HYPO|nr:nuclear pore [Fusarium beomiforme]